MRRLHYFPPQFSPDKLLSFIATTPNRHPHLFHLFEFPVAHFTHLTIDDHSPNLKREIPLPDLPLPLPLNHNLIHLYPSFVLHSLPSFLSFYPSQSLPPPQPPPSVFQKTPSVPFAAPFDPIKLFDGLDHTYPPEMFLAHNGARVTLQLGQQPLEIQPR